MGQVSNLNQSPPHDFEQHDHAGGAVITAIEMPGRTSMCIKASRTPLQSWATD